MKTLAIIPVCEGSRTLPNKNMRVLNGKPMIYYVINNAKKCKYIDDVIVTSNSSDILLIAKQMDVLTRKRDISLDGYDVSLDKVVFDVFNQVNINDYDIVITMQSISPMLKLETLNLAFEDYFKNDYDTLISVKDMKFFFWEKNDSRALPIYKSRGSRHNLPPFYMETGAFLITKSKFISEENRIGNNVGLYELNGIEAIDANGFSDLQLMENALNYKTSAIYVNGNNEIGLGHISRVLQIADEFYVKPDIYFDKNSTKIDSFGETKYDLYPVDGDDGFIECLKSCHYDIIINDILNTSAEYMRKIKENNLHSKIINFEDDGEGAKFADLVINALYEEKKNDNVACGSKYFIIPKLFLIFDPIDIKEKIIDVIVTFGGADPQNYTEKTLEIIKNPLYKYFHFHVVVGRANKNIKIITNKYNNYENITIYHDINNIAELMSKCDVAISSRGRTCFELTYLGIPTLSIAQHTREEQHKFISEENGFLCLMHNPSKKQIEENIHKLLHLTKNDRLCLQEKMLKHDLKNGRKNVARIIMKDE